MNTARNPIGEAESPHGRHVFGEQIGDRGGQQHEEDQDQADRQFDACRS